VKSAVLVEQARQKESNLPNSELLARYSECATQNSRAFACWMGIGDAWAAGQEVSMEKVEMCGLPSGLSPLGKKEYRDPNDASCSDPNVSKVKKCTDAFEGNSSQP
jgi:hypothetical protein